MRINSILVLLFLFAVYELGTASKKQHKVKAPHVKQAPSIPHASGSGSGSGDIPDNSGSGSGSGNEDEDGSGSGSGEPTPTCVDKSKNCDRAARYCRLPKLEATLRSNCQATCGYCSSNTCRDINPSCASWNRNGFCASSFYDQAFKRQNCGVTCNFCGSPQTSNAARRTRTASKKHKNVKTNHISNKKKHEKV